MLSSAAEARLRQAERAENFPVAARLLPSPERAHLRAVYDVVRVIDDLGDEADGDRVEQLHRFADDLALVWTGEPRSPVLRRLEPTVKACDLPRDPFNRLIAANRQDQEVNRYKTWTDLLGYCRLSADPIGRLVLGVFGVDAPPGGLVERESDAVCVALQVLEHLQDVGEDRRRRPHLPARRRPPRGRGARGGPRRGRRVACAAQVDRPRDGPGPRPAGPRCARDAPAARLGALGGRRLRRRWPRGGRLAVPPGWDVLSRPPKTRRRDVARHLVGGLLGSVR